MGSRAKVGSLERAKARLLDELRLDIQDQRVLEVIARVPRERFVPAEMQPFAYDNRPLPIGYGQTISQPLIVGLMTQTLALAGGEKVLEVGTGSGYQAAVLSLLAEEVISVERVALLAERAAQILSELGYLNVRVYLADPFELGRPQDAPYDAIIVTASAPAVPQSLVEQLREGGRMVLPVGGREAQELTLVTKGVEGGYAVQNLGGCRFVPLIGVDAWSEADLWEEL